MKSRIFTNSPLIARILVLFVVYSCKFAMPAYCFNESSARAVGMNFAYSAVGRGFESVGWNPACLWFSDGPIFSVQLAAVGMGFTGQGLTLQKYNDYTGNFLGEKEKEDILGRIDKADITKYLGAELRVFGIHYGPFAITNYVSTATSITIPKEIIDLILYGNRIDSTYYIDRLDGEGWVLSSHCFSLGKSFETGTNKEIGIGATLKYLRGYGYFSVDSSSGFLTTTEDFIDAEGKVALRYASGGGGYAVDIGVCTKIGKLTAGISIINLMGEILWVDKTMRVEYTYEIDSVNGENMSDEKAHVSDAYYEIDSFESEMPLLFRVGIAYSLDKILFGLDYVLISNNSKISCGIEWNVLNFLALRAGLGINDEYRFTSSFGIGLKIGVLNLDIGIAALNPALFMESEDLFFALALSIE